MAAYHNDDATRSSDYFLRQHKRLARQFVGDFGPDYIDSPHAHDEVHLQRKMSLLNSTDNEEACSSSSVFGCIIANAFAENNHQEIPLAVLEVILILVFIFGTVLNTILVVVFCRRRGFRSCLSNRFLINLVASNLLVAIVQVPLVFAHLHLGHRQALCLALRVLIKLTSSASIFGQLLIGIDQYLAVINPLTYHRNINTTRCKIMCISTWIISGLLAGLCSLDLSPGYARTSDLLYFSLAFVLPIGLIFIIYCQIFIAARSNSIKTRRNSSCSMTQEGVNQHHQVYSKYLDVSNNNTDLSRSPSMRSTTSNILHLTSNLRASMRSKLSHASNLLIYGEESRAAKVTILVLFSIFSCWLPLCFVAFYTHLNPGRLPLWLLQVAIICSHCNVVFSPILYAFRSKRVQHDVRKVFGLNMRSKGQPSSQGRIRRIRNSDHKKVHRLKSLSCPQLLISSVNENENSSVTYKSSLLTEKEPITSSAKISSMMLLQLKN